MQWLYLHNFIVIIDFVRCYQQCISCIYNYKHSTVQYMWKLQQGNNVIYMICIIWCSVIFHIECYVIYNYIQSLITNETNK